MGFLLPRGWADPPPGPDTPALLDSWHREALAAWDEAFERESGKTIDFTPRLHRCETPHELWKRCWRETQSLRFVPCGLVGYETVQYVTADGTMTVDPEIGRGDRETLGELVSTHTLERLEEMISAINETTDLVNSAPGAIHVVRPRRKG